MLVNFLGIKINVEDPLVKSLKNFYGMGKHQVKALCCILGLSLNISFKHLNVKKRKKLRNLLRKMVFGSNLLKIKLNFIENLKSNGSFKGFRHKKNLPVRGQRTRSNACTRRKGII